MEISGKIYRVMPVEQVSASFRKRNIVVETEEQYPQKVLIEFTQDKCDLLNQYLPGMAVRVSINLRGREWINPQGEEKFFNSIQGWKIENTGGNTYQQAAAPATQNSPQQTHGSFNQEEHDDLPF